MFKNWGKINAENWSWILILSILAGFVGIVICDFFSFLLFHVHAYGSLIVVFVFYVVFTFVGFILSVTLSLAIIRLFEEENPTVAELKKSNPSLYQKLAVLHQAELKPHCIECGSEMRVKTRFSVLSYDPETGYPNKKEMEVFCKNKTALGGRHNWYLIILDGNDNPV